MFAGFFFAKKRNRAKHGDAKNAAGIAYNALKKR
jgi:hypothetical protein